MIPTHELREQMRKVARTLASGGAGAATAAIQKTLNSGTAKAFGTTDAIPDFVKNLLAQLGVPAAEQGWGGNQNRRSSPPHAAPEYAAEETSDQSEGKSRGQFLNKSFTNQDGTRAYKLYIPGSYCGQAMPLVVMLHGCTQNPDDFSNGTRMNRIAEEQQCFVVYPAQGQSANASKCWNWFKADNQQRGQGEPSIIAGITREVASNYQLDADRVYVAGLSSGGAMAVIMAATYPELYAAVGVHSGLPYASAHDLPSALAAMRGSVPGSHRAYPPSPDSRASSTPIIIFHGDADSTVNACNGEQLMQQNLREAAPDKHSGARRRQPNVIVEQGQVPNGHRYTCTSHHDDEGRILAEQWLIHGAGHAWAGGSSSGSYTDPKGPDATREMLRFFYAHAQATQQT